MSNNDQNLERYFGYIPSIPLAAVAMAAFFAISTPLFYQSYCNHNRLTYVLPVTAILEFTGYALRLYLIEHVSLTIYVFMGFMIIVAPNALAFANYKVLGKIIQTKAVHLHLPSVSASVAVAVSAAGTPGVSSSSHPYSSYSALADRSSGADLIHSKCRFYVPYVMNESGEVHGNRVAAFFFLSDIAAILLQGGGAGLQTSSNPDFGTNVLLFGLASQLFFFGIFTFLAVYVYVSPLYNQSMQSIAVENNVLLTKAHYDSAFAGLFSTITLLFVRNFYRVIEFALGYRGYLATKESLMYVFDTLFIFLALVMYVYYNFARFLSKADEQLHKDLFIHGNGNTSASADATNNKNENICLRVMMARRTTISPFQVKQEDIGVNIA